MLHLFLHTHTLKIRVSFVMLLVYLWFPCPGIAEQKNIIISEIKKYTDRPIEIREKINKKQRTSLYEQLMKGDYYCTVSINSRCF